MKKSLKVYLQTNCEIRCFYWFEVGSDSSIYCGSTCSKIFTYGYKGADRTTPQGSEICIAEGVTQSTDELLRKHSFHQSGIINLPTVQNGKGDRLFAKSLDNQNYPMPLFGIVPMNPTKYPVSKKKIKEGSIIINCGLNHGKSFGLIFYVSKDCSEPSLIQKLRHDGFYATFKNEALDKYYLGLIIYHDSHFIGWPQEQIKIISHPNGNRELNWPLLVPS
jgi:hypothetical protein